MSSLSWGQESCSGSLGENIFTAGDFGRGTSNLIVQDPMIAPGYSYTRNPPPDDGFYTITNSTAMWGGLFGTWLAIPDNSFDPFGYMMVVNASFEPGLFYEQTVDGLCENTLYEFSADIINLIRIGVPDHINPNVSFIIDTTDAFSTGAVPQDEDWHTYGFSFTTGPNQTSVRLALSNNAPGGIGNDLALDNITFRPCGPEAFILPDQIENICQDGEPIQLEATIVGNQYAETAYQWQQSFDQGDTWEDIEGANDSIFLHNGRPAGDYYYRFALANSPLNIVNERCRVTSTFKIVRVLPRIYEVTDTLCAGLEYQVGSQSYDATGTYMDSFVSVFGCDSIVLLNLLVVEDGGIEPTLSIGDATCHDTEDGTLTITDIQNGTAPYSILLDGDLIGRVNSAFDNVLAGPHQLQITDRFGCLYDEEVTINSPEAFVIDIGNDTTVVLGQQVQIVPITNFPISTYNWEPAIDSFCNPDCSSFIITPFDQINLTLEAVNENGCIATDSKLIEVIQNRLVFFPNVFSPNDDTQNDFFNAHGTENVQSVELLTVFDRWGNIVYQARNLAVNQEQSGWDGMINGVQAKPGVYAYTAQIRYVDQQTRLSKGTVTLVR